MMEQMCQSYCDDTECKCSSQEEKENCTCFLVINNRVLGRVNELQKMTMRLYFSSSTSNADLNTNMRMREMRTLWSNSNDLVLTRNAKLLKTKTENWAKEADDALDKLANILGLNIIHPETQETDDAHMMFADSDSEDENLRASLSNMRTQSQSQFDAADSSVGSEVKKFLKQSPAHFAKCKLFSVFCGISG